MKQKLLFSITILFFFTTGFAQQNTRDTIGSAINSTVLLLMYDKNNQPLPLGSGFVIDKNIVATNFHIIENSASGFAVLNGNLPKFSITGIIKKNERLDLALLYVEGLDVPKVKLVDSSRVEIGDIVYAIGNPTGLEGKSSPGIISGVVDLRSSLIDLRKDTMLQITAPIPPVCSGGPVINAYGEVIGVAVTIIKEDINFNFAIPIAYLKASSLNIKEHVYTFNKSTRLHSSLLSLNWSKSLKEAVTGTNFKFDTNLNSGFYFFTVHNNLNKPVKNIKCQVIFYNADQLPIETEHVAIEGIIGPKLAKRTEGLGRARRGEVRDLTYWTEIRILSFEIVD